MNERLEKVRAEIASFNLDALLVTDIVNVRYLSGFTGTAGCLLILPKATCSKPPFADAYVLTDARYTEQAAQEAAGFQVEAVENKWVEGAASLLTRLGLRNIGFESGSLTHHAWKLLSDAIPDAAVTPTEGVIERLRMVKDESEISAIREAAGIADAAYTHIASAIRPGMTEKEAALEIEFFMRRHGADKEAFDSIVASGPRSALPHGKPTNRRIAESDFITLDFGARFEGYHSDITRTVMLGDPDARQREVFEVVREAQEKAIAAIRPGISGGQVDAVARDYIAAKGYGERFGHGLGHGLGLAVHDNRILARGSEIELQPGMVVTVEPGIYIPGWGGVRIEDDVLVTESGAEVLTHAPRELRLCGS